MAALALGRFVFLPYHRRSLAKAGMPTQNGKTHLQAGDLRAEEASFVVRRRLMALLLGRGLCLRSRQQLPTPRAGVATAFRRLWAQAALCCAHQPHSSLPSQPAAPQLKTNDPAGFTIVDVMAWGALGHAAAFYLLATSSLGAASKAPIPF